MPTVKSTITVADHFTRSLPNVRATYDAILDAAKALGPVTEEPKKTSIHLVRTHAFAGVATRKGNLILTLKADRAVNSARARRVDKASRKRWYFEVPLSTPSDVDAELRAWIAASYNLS
jgi:hypothetical protein